MSIIAHNMAAINANKNLAFSTRGMALSMEKLSSGYKINTGKDDPSGLVISEKLRSQISGLERAKQNTEEAINVLGIAEGALNEMNNILKKMKQLAIHAASDGVTSPDQIAADQAEIDSGVQTIDRIARTTKFSNQNLLDGSKEIVFDQNTLTKGTQQNKLVDVGGSHFDQIFRRQNYVVSINYIGTQNPDNVTGIGDVDFSKQAMKAYLEIDTAKGSLSQVDENGNVTQAQTFILTGTKGSRRFNYDKGTHISTIVSEIQSSSGTTGVNASLVFNSAQKIDRLDIADFSGNSLNVGITGLNDAQGNQVGMTLIGELKQAITNRDGVLGVELGDIDANGNTLFNVYYDGALVYEGWDGKKGRMELSGALAGLDLEVDSDVSLLNSMPDAIASIGLDNNTVCSNIWERTAASGGTLSIDNIPIGPHLSTAIGPNGTIEFEVLPGASGGTPSTVHFNMTAKDKDGNIISRIQNGSLSITDATATEGGLTITLANAGAGDPSDIDSGLLIGLTFGYTGATAAQGWALTSMPSKEEVKAVNWTLDPNDNNRSCVGDDSVPNADQIDFTSLNPVARTIIDYTKLCSREVDLVYSPINILTLDQSTGNFSPLDIQIEGQLRNLRGFADIADQDMQFQIYIDNAADQNTPPTYTLMFGQETIATNWDGKASSIRGSGILEGLTFTTVQDINAGATFDMNFLPNPVASQQSVNTSIYSGGTGGKASFSIDESVMSDELKAYIADGYSLVLTPVSSDVVIGGGGGDVGFTIALAKGTERLHATNAYVSVATDGTVVLGNAKSSKGGANDLSGLFNGLQIAITGANATGGPAAVDSSSTATAQHATDIQYTYVVPGNIGTGRLDKYDFLNGLPPRDTIAMASSITGGISTNDDASRAKGTVAVFNNTIATDGSGRVERGVTSVEFEIENNRGIKYNTYNNIQFGLNTDGQGRIYVKFIDGENYELYKDASCSPESKVASGKNGQACRAANNSGLDGLILETTVGPGHDIFNEKGVYISFAGIEGDNDGVIFDGDVIADRSPSADPMKGTGSFEPDRTLITGVELGTNTSSEGNLYTKTVYDANTNTVQVFAYKNKNMSDADLVAKSEKYSTMVNGEDVKSMSVVLNEVRNDDDSDGTGLGIVVSFENYAFRNMDTSTTLEGRMTFTNLGARVYSEDYGSNAFVKVNQTQGGIFTYYVTPDNANSQTLIEAGKTSKTVQVNGQDAFISVNGQQLMTSGLDLNVATQDLQARLKFYAGQVGSTTIAQVGYGEGSIFTKIGALNLKSDEPNCEGLSGLLCNAGHNTAEEMGQFQSGMQLQLGESEGDQDRTVVSIQTMTAENLGRVVKSGYWEKGKEILSDREFTMKDIMSGHAGSLTSDPLLAMAVIEKSINDVTELRARLGAFQANLLQTNSNNLAIAIENITKTESAIRDTDMASQMTEYTKDQVLNSAGVSMLTQANQLPQNILQLLR